MTMEDATPIVSAGCEAGGLDSIPASDTSAPSGEEDESSILLCVPVQTNADVEEVQPNGDADEDNGRIIYIEELPPYQSRRHITVRNPSAPVRCEDWSRKKLCMCWTALCAIQLLVLGSIAFFVMRSKTNGSEDNEVTSGVDDWDLETRAYELKSMLSKVSGPSSFLDSVSPQARALDWLVYEDTLLASADDDNLFQRYAVLLFAFAANAELWRVAEPWYELTGSHECTFEGVDCDLDKQVTTIDLPLRKISGTLPEELGLLTGLSYLGLGQNLLEGTIPDSLFMKLTKLQTLDLALNDLSSTLSSHIGRLESLKFLYLSRNSIHGDLPDSLKTLTNLEQVHLTRTKLRGPIFDFLIEWPNLEFTDISRSQFTGSVPTEMGTLTNLETFICTDTDLNVTLPTEMGLLTRLNTLVISSYNIDGRSIPTEIGNLSSLNVLTLQGHFFAGTIPTEIGYLSLLTVLSLEDARLTGEIPSEFGTLTNLEILLLLSNYLEGTIPSELGNLAANLRVFKIFSNQLVGSMPAEFCSSPAHVDHDCSVECDCCLYQDCRH